MHTLIIIDMQPCFTSSDNEYLKKNILREIDICKRNNWLIIVLEYVGCCKTYEYISKTLERYSKAYFSKKYDDDGSNTVIDLLKDKKLTKSKKLRLVGVNTDYCVYETACGLKHYGYNITIVNDACRSESLRTFNKQKIFLTKTKFNIIRNRIFGNKF